jgi:hypothetical protein
LLVKNVCVEIKRFFGCHGGGTFEHSYYSKHTISCQPLFD